ncbi:MAG: NosD domain-containing protein [Chloroflexota bacterium]
MVFPIAADELQEEPGAAAELVVQANAGRQLTVDNGHSDCSDDDGTPFCTIQAAVDVAEAADTITVIGNDFANVYLEAVMITQNNLTLVGQGYPVVATLSEEGTAVSITANNISLQGFALGFSHVGLVLSEAEGATISDNVISYNFEAGIVAAGGQNNRLLANLISWQGGAGVLLVKEVGDVLEGNTAVLNGHWSNARNSTENIGDQLRSAMQSSKTSLETVQANPVIQPEALQKSLETLQPLLLDVPTTNENQSAPLADSVPSSGIIAYETENLRIESNVAAGNLMGGILLLEAEQAHIEANELFLNGLFGIGLGASSQNRLQANQLAFNFGWAGIWVAEESQQNSVVDNHIFFQQHLELDWPLDEAASILVVSDGNEILGNEMGFGDHYGLVVFGHGNQIIGNEAVGNGHHRHGNNATTEQSAEAGNRAKKQRRSGHLIVGNNNVLQENTASLNGRYGFRLIGSNNTMQANEAWGNHRDGFRLEGQANLIADNASFHNRGFGFFNVGDNSYSNNQCGNNRHGSHPVACIE